MLSHSAKFRNIALVTLILFGSALQGYFAKIEPAEPKYYPYSEDEIFPVFIGDENLMGYVNDSYEIVIEPQFDWASEFSEGLAVASTGPLSQDGYIDLSGEWVIEPQYKSASAFKNGLALTMQLDNPSASDGIEYWNFIDSSGKKKMKMKPDYFRVSSFSEGLAPANIKYLTNRGFIDEKGELVVEGYDDVYSFQEGLAAVSKDGKWGYIDRTGEVVLPLIYEDTFSFYEQKAAVKIGNKWGFINHQGEEVLAPQYDSARFFKEGVALVEYEGKFGFIDPAGEWVIPAEFDDAKDFSEGLAAVFVDNIKRWGYINKKGEMVIEPKYREAFPARHGLMRVSRVQDQIARYSYIDRNGNDVEFKPLPKS